MTLRINSEAPDFTAETTEGSINFHKWIGDCWAILFSHPKDFTPVCTTELGYMAGLKKEFDKRNCKIIGLSVDSVSDHKKWSKDIEETQGHAINYPLIGDPELKVAKVYDMLPEDVEASARERTAVDNAVQERAGFREVYSMAGGINAWMGLVAEGFPEAGISWFSAASSANELAALACVLEDGTKISMK